jgi:hypothetical protein
LLYTIAQVGTQITIGGMIFFLVAWILKAEELVLLSRMIRRRHSGVEVLA